VNPLKKSDIYLFSELLLPFFIGTFALIMMMVGTTLYALLESLLREKWPLPVILKILALNIPAVLVLALPVATSLAVSLAVNRLARDNEITALRGMGISLTRIFMPVLVFGLLVAAADLYLSDAVVPWASKEQQSAQFYLDSLPKNKIDAGLTVSRDNFTITFGSREKVSDTKYRLYKVIVVEAAKTNLEYAIITTADTMEYENGVWTAAPVVTHYYNPDGTTRMDVLAESFTLPLAIDFSLAYRTNSGNEAMTLTLKEITEKATAAREQGLTRQALTYETERWFKLSLPAMCAVFAFCAPPLAMKFSRGGSFTGILLSIILVFVGWNTLLLMKYFALGGVVPPIIAAWTTNLLFTLLGLVLIRTQE